MSRILEQVTAASLNKAEPNPNIDWTAGLDDFHYGKTLYSYTIGVKFASTIALDNKSDLEFAIQAIRGNYANYIFGEYRGPLLEAQRMILEGKRIQAAQIIDRILQSMEL